MTVGAAWDPDRYRRYAGHRFRPGLDLIARIPPIDPTTIVDLGCGTGDLTAALAERWPEARVTGLDTSAEMLARARAAHPAIDWIEADIGHWSPAAPVDLIYTNAALHWLGGHDTLFDRLIGHLAPGGVLACQMPRNFAAPSHALMREVAADSRWAGRIALLGEPVDSPEVYWDRLHGRVAHLDIWQTEYLQELAGDDPVLDWVRSTALRPVLAALEGNELDAFLAAYGAKLRVAYPKRADGVTLFPFNRLFIVAQVPAG